MNGEFCFVPASEFINEYLVEGSTACREMILILNETLKEHVRS